MSLEAILDRDNLAPLSWTNLKFNRLRALEGKIEGNFEFTGDLIGQISHLNLPAGAPLHFLRLNALATAIEFTALTENTISPGNVNSVLASDGSTNFWDSSPVLDNLEVLNTFACNEVQNSGFINILEPVEGLQVAGNFGSSHQVLTKSSLNELIWSDDVTVNGELNLLGQVLRVNSLQGLPNNLLGKNGLNELEWLSSIAVNNVTTGQLTLSNVSGNANDIIQKTSGNVPGWVAPNRISWWSLGSAFDYNSNILDGYVGINPTARYNNLGGVIELHNSNTFFTSFVNGFFKVTCNIQASAQTSSTVGFSLRVNNVVVASGILFPSQTALTLHYVGLVGLGANIDLRSVRVGDAVSKSNFANNLASYFLIERIY